MNNYEITVYIGAVVATIALISTYFLTHHNIGEKK